MLLSTAWGDISQQSRNHSRLRRLCLVRRGSHSSSLPSSVQVPPSAATSSVADPTLHALVPHPSLLIRAPSQEAPQAAPLVLHDHGTMAGPFSTSLSTAPQFTPCERLGQQSRNTSTPVQSACASACALRLGASRHGARIAPAGDRGRGRRRGRPYPCGGIRLQAGQRVRRPQRGAAAALPGGTAHLLRQLRRAAGGAARRARAQGDLFARVPRGRRRVAGACATRQPLTRPPPTFFCNVARGIERSWGAPARRLQPEA